MPPITVRINEERRDLPAGTAVAGLLQQLQLADAAVAVAVNGRFVPRSLYADHTLEPGDRIELVAPMAGG